MDSMFCHWISLTVEYKSATNDGLGIAVGRSMGVVYVDDGRLGSRYPEWLYGDINVLIRIFRRVGLMANVAKYKIMTCQPGAICTGTLEEAFIWRSTGEGDPYREHLSR